MWRLRLIATPGITVLLGFGAAWVLCALWCGGPNQAPLKSDPDKPLPPGIAEDSRLRLGMSIDEVDAAIGIPPGYYDTTRPEVPRSMSPGVSLVLEVGLPETSLPDAAGRPKPAYPGKLTVRRWIWSDYCIWVAFDNRPRVVGYYLLKITYDPFRHPAAARQS